jgi:hypothetical protein
MEENKQIVKTDYSMTKIMDNISEEDLGTLIREAYENSNEVPEFTLEDIIAIKKYMIEVLKGSTAFLSLICTGDRCVYASTCKILLLKKTPPLGHTCPIEALMKKQMFEDFVRDAEIDRLNRVEVSQINDLVEVEILNSRINSILAKEGLIVENIVGIDPDNGRELTRKEKHPVFDIKDQILKRRDRILKQLVLSRDAKLQSQSKTEDAVIWASKMQRLIEEKAAEHAKLDFAKETSNIKYITQEENENT